MSLNMSSEKKLSLHHLTGTLPLCRPQLFEEIVVDKKYGPIHMVWMTPGHIFVSVQNGKMLYTFDTKPTSKIQEESRGCLDLDEMNFPCLDVIVCPENFNIVFIVHTNGHVQCWKYRQDFTWNLQRTFDLCSVPNTEVTNVCYHCNQSTFFWCEKRVSSTFDINLFCICSRYVPNQDEEFSKDKNLGPTQVVLHNCPNAVVYPVALGLAIFFKLKGPLLNLLLVWSPVTDEIKAYLSLECVPLDEVINRSIDFSQLIFKLAFHSQKIVPEKALSHVLYDNFSNDVTLIDASRKIKCITRSSSQSNSICLDMNKVCHSQSFWLDLASCIGLTCGCEIKLYDKSTGAYMGSVSSPDQTNITDKCRSSCLPWSVITSEQNVYTILQKKSGPFEKIDDIFSSNDFQTPVFYIAHLEQQKLPVETEDSVTTYHLLHKLKNKWKGKTKKSARTNLQALMYPYLTHYWDLCVYEEEMFDLIQNFASLPSIEEEIIHTLNPETSHSSSSRHALILWMSYTDPKNVLDVLMTTLDFEPEVISTAQLQRWQCILAEPGAYEGAASKDIAVSMFEYVCWLFFILQPCKLVNFVKLAQYINDQRVGVSAFARKKQTQQFFDRALNCLPSIEASQDIFHAVQAQAALLDIREEEESKIQALKTLLKYKCWSQAFDYFQSYSNKSALQINMFHLIIQAISKEVTFHDYSRIFQMMPNNIRFSSFMPLAIIDTQGSASAKDIFADTSNSLELKCAKECFLNTITCACINENAPIN